MVRKDHIAVDTTYMDEIYNTVYTSLLSNTTRFHSYCVTILATVLPTGIPIQPHCMVLTLYSFAVLNILYPNGYRACCLLRNIYKYLPHARNYSYISFQINLFYVHTYLHYPR